MPILLPAAKGRYLNVVGLMNRKNNLFFEVATTTFNSDKMIDFIERFILQIKQKTVVILDNAPIHKSKKFMKKVKEWKLQDLYIYFLPPYSPELNIIEILWRKIKYNWMPLDSYLNFEKLTENLNYALNNFGEKYDIKF